MEFRVLKYFLAVAREENISAAAESLHVTQPTLSRQLMGLGGGAWKNAVYPREPADHAHRRRDAAAQTCGRNCQPCR